MSRWGLDQSLGLLISKGARAGERNQADCHHMPGTAMTTETLAEDIKCQCSLPTLWPCTVKTLVFVNSQFYGLDNSCKSTGWTGLALLEKTMKTEFSVSYEMLYMLWLFSRVIDLGEQEFHCQLPLWFTVMIWKMICALFTRGRFQEKFGDLWKLMPQNGIRRKKASAAVIRWPFLCEPGSLVGWLDGRFTGSLPCLTQASKTGKLPFYRGYGDSKRHLFPQPHLL